MIEQLEGSHEIVNYQNEFKVKIHMNDEDAAYPDHWHLDTEIIMPIEEAYQVNVNNENHLLEVGDIVLIPSGELHTVSSVSGGQRIILQFDALVLQHFQWFLTANTLYHPYVLVDQKANPRLNQKLRRLLEKIIQEYRQGKPFSQAAIFSSLLEFLVLIIRARMNEKEHLKDRLVYEKKHLQNMTRIMEVCQYINHQYTEDLPLDALAKVAGMSKFHLAKVFKKILKITCHDYILLQRTKAAEKLLLSPDLSILQVSLQAGFSSLSTFNRVFKKKNMCTPTDYRSAHSNH